MKIHFVVSFQKSIGFAKGTKTIHCSGLGWESCDWREKYTVTEQYVLCNEAKGGTFICCDENGATYKTFNQENAELYCAKSGAPSAASSSAGSSIGSTESSD